MLRDAARIRGWVGGLTEIHRLITSIFTLEMSTGVENLRFTAGAHAPPLRPRTGARINPHDGSKAPRLFRRFSSFLSASPYSRMSALHASGERGGAHWAKGLRGSACLTWRLVESAVSSCAAPIAAPSSAPPTAEPLSSRRRLAIARKEGSLKSLSPHTERDNWRGRP